MPLPHALDQCLTLSGQVNPASPPPAHAAGFAPGSALGATSSRALTPAQRVDVRRQRDPYAAYERMKRELPADLTPAQYTAACRALAKKAGI